MNIHNCIVEVNTYDEYVFTRYGERHIKKLKYEKYNTRVIYNRIILQLFHAEV